MEFAGARVGAAALAAAGDVEAFLLYLGGDFQPDLQLRQRIHQALVRYERIRRQHDALVQFTQQHLWEGVPTQHDALVKMEIRRRALGDHLICPTRMFSFLTKKMKQANMAAVRFAIPTPRDVFEQWGDVINHPDMLYAAPSRLPDIDVSASVLGPTGREYLLRFASPASFLDDMVYARVFEPESWSGNLSTFIYGSGLGMSYDLISYWPEEDYMARPLVSHGCRTILLESPWHGRRTPSGLATGEQYLATAPVGLLQLYGAQTQETAVLIQWAREQGASSVGVGGVSLGGIVAQQVASRCHNWPAAMQPDMVFLGASSHLIDKVATTGEMAEILGLDAALRAVGWTPDHLAKLRSVLDPSPQLGIAPDDLYGAFGTRDTYVPFEYTKTMLSNWGVPDKNIITWNVGHMGLLLKLFRTFEAQQMILCGLKKVSKALIKVITFRMLVQFQAWGRVMYAHM